MADVVKNISFKTSIEGTKDVAKGFGDINTAFDGVSVTTEDLKDRLADLALQTEQVKDEFGKYYKGAPDMIRIDRERGLATAELTRLEDIAANKTKIRTRGLGSLAGMLLRATTGTTGMSRGVSILTTGLVGGVGLTAALAVAVLVIKEIVESFGDASEQLKNLTKDVKDNWTETKKVASAWDDFTVSIKKWSKEDLAASIEGLRIQIDELTPGLWQLFLASATSGASLFKRMEQIKKVTKELAIIQEQYSIGIKETTKASNNLFPDAINATGALREGTKDLNKELEKTIEAMHKIRTMTLATGAARGGVFEAFGGREITGREAEAPIKELAEGTEAGLKEGFEKSTQMMENVAQSWTSVLSSNFNAFWDDTFGYANSLLEQLLKMTFTSFASAAFSFIPFGGILKSIFDPASPGGRGVGGATSNVIVLKIGDENIASFILKGNEVIRMRGLS